MYRDQHLLPNSHWLRTPRWYTKPGLVFIVPSVHSARTLEYVLLQALGQGNSKSERTFPSSLLLPHLRGQRTEKGPEPQGPSSQKALVHLALGNLCIFPWSALDHETSMIQAALRDILGLAPDCRNKVNYPKSHMNFFGFLVLTTVMFTLHCSQLRV